MLPSPVLSVEDLTVSYSGVPALRNATLSVDSGEAVSILGANGAGKSTLLRTIAGLNAVTSGRIAFNGAPLPQEKPEQISSLGIALVPEGRQIFAGLTVRENLLVGIRKSRTETEAEILDDVLAWFPVLRDFLGRHGGALSGGQQQQLAIARAMVTRPSLILLDEPSLGLSPVMMDAVFEAITRMTAAGVSVVLVEQNATRALEVTSRAYGLRRGDLVFEKRSEELLFGSEMEELYLGGQL